MVAQNQESGNLVVGKGTIRVWFITLISAMMARERFGPPAWMLMGSQLHFYLFTGIIIIYNNLLKTTHPTKFQSSLQSKRLVKMAINTNIFFFISLFLFFKYYLQLYRPCKITELCQFGEISCSPI